MKLETKIRRHTRNRSTFDLMIRLIISVLFLALVMVATSCAGTSLYGPDGKKIAGMQGDMTGVEYTLGADGSVKFKAAKVAHSPATRASAERIQHAGTAVAASGLTTLLLK